MPKIKMDDYEPKLFSCIRSRFGSEELVGETDCGQCCSEDTELTEALLQEEIERVIKYHDKLLDIREKMKGNWEDDN